MMSLVEHAKAELEYAGFSKDKVDGPGQWMQADVLELIEVFAKQGHSGWSAATCIAMFTKLAAYEPLTPLTGADDEWNEVGEPHDSYYQNKRCSRVFKNKDGTAYDIDAKVFREPNGVCYVNNDSRVFIEFPYTPKREFIDVEVIDG